MFVVFISLQSCLKIRKGPFTIVQKAFIIVLLEQNVRLQRNLVDLSILRLPLLPSRSQY